MEEGVGKAGVALVVDACRFGALLMVWLIILIFFFEGEQLREEVETKEGCSCDADDGGCDPRRLPGVVDKEEIHEYEDSSDIY